MFERTVHVSWAQVDPNRHLRNTAYIDAAVDVRLMYFATHGFDHDAFHRHGIGPIARSDHITYLREVPMFDTLRINIACAGRSTDGSRWVLRQEIRRGDGVLAARLDTSGGFLDLAARRLCLPPPPLLAALDALERIADYVVLPSSVTRPGSRAGDEHASGNLQPTVDPAEDGR
jgi:acyl-CoA thioester hydrolase